MLAKFSATMFRHYAAALVMRQHCFMPSNASTLLTIIISCSVLLVTIQPICAKSADEQLVASIKLSALKAESVGDLAKAEFLYLKALAESEKTGSTLRILESLVHVVHIKTIRGKLKEAEPFYKRAIDLAQNAMRKPGCNAEVTVWLEIWPMHTIQQDNLLTTRKSRSSASNTTSIARCCALQSTTQS